ncbi:MAG: AAA family ATPase, partial [Chloroflexota bacterium]
MIVRSALNLPEGTVTFLFTDIQGSTQLLHQLGDRYIQLLADHHRILREIFARWNGREVDTEGDAFFVSFPRATDAISGAVEAQRALAEYDWPEGVTVRVRMGLHTGEPWTAQEGYVGMDVHRAARIAHVGYGGQVLLSETTTALVIDQLPEDITLLDLGQHRLKDMKRPEHIRQLVIKGLRSEFPALKSLGVVEPVEIYESQPARLPRFLEKDKGEPERPVFVGREAELSRLDGFLESMLAGKSQMVFLAGDAGSGKSSLMSAFATRASEREPELLVGWGIGNAFSGRGDPYLPFRKALATLTGDVEAEWAAGKITTDQARTLWEAMPLAIDALLDRGPDLINTIVKAEPLLDHLELAYPAGHPTLARLREKTEAKTQAGQLERESLFEQVTATLRHLAESQPVVIALDDLQWADRGSLDLLFHLVRGLDGARILLLVAYRPDEVTADKAHPLRPLLDEFRRSYGDVWLDLNQVPGRAFVDELIDSEANHLDEAFRKTLNQRTGGHPLFTVELLRNMQERGDLVKDDEGNWIKGPSLDWDTLPVRVEGAIEARIGRLEEELREILTVAAVEGEAFTAQVVAQVQEIQERKLLRTLSKELQKRHKLVQEDQVERIGRQIISRYRFVHHMFQRYLYNDLSETERQLLHGEVGEILETLYDDKSDEVVVQLARHFDEAGESEKAAGYLLTAGDRARALYANEEAIDHYQRALAHLELLGEDERLARTWMRLGLTYHNAFDYGRSRQAYERGFAIWHQVGLGSQASRAGAPLNVWLISPDTLDPPYAYSSIGAIWLLQLFSGLVEVNDQMVIVPDVARRWEISDNGQTYVFHLREDAGWSDGHPVTAADFVLAWRRMLAPQTP